MIPVFTSKFLVSGLQVRLTDTYNYAALIKDAVYANITAKVGNSIFHQNTDFNASADIVIGTNSAVNIDLPVSDGNILNGTYTITEAVKIINEVLYASSVNSGYMAVSAPVGNNFTTTTPSVPPDFFTADINVLLDSGLADTRVGFYNSSNVLLGSTTLNSCSADILHFAATNIAAFATIAKIRIIGTNTYTTTHIYTYSGCPVVTPKLQALTDCYRSQLSITDCTVYPVGTTLTRTITAQYPTLPDGSHVLPTETTSDASLTLGPNIWTGGYNISLTSQVDSKQTDNLYISITVTAAIYPNVQCSSGLCALSVCIAKFRNKYLAAVALGSKQTQALFSDNFTIGLYLDAINIAVQCEDSAAATSLITALTTFMGEGTSSDGCDCGCSDATTNGQPTEVFPLFTTPSTDGKVVDYSASVPYPVKQMVVFEGQLFRVVTATVAGQSPNTNRSKFKYMGGGVNAGNTVNSILTTATINTTSGVVSFSGLTPANFTDQFSISITNTTISAGSDVECYLTGCSDGQGAIVNKFISNNTITLFVENLNNAGDPLFEFSVWFNNKV